jgi:hypothetical protein
MLHPSNNATYFTSLPRNPDMSNLHVTITTGQHIGPTQGELAWGRSTKDVVFQRC